MLYFTALSPVSSPTHRSSPPQPSKLKKHQKYQRLSQNEHGWLWCQRLELWLGTWEGTIDRKTAVWLRFYDQAGNV